MHFHALEAYQAKFPKFSGLIDTFDNYLFDSLSLSKDRDISLPLVANKLGVNESIALVLLNFAYEAGLLVPLYHVYCPTNEDFIASFPTKEDLPDTIFCPYDEMQFNKHEYLVELTFQFTDVIKRQSIVTVT